MAQDGAESARPSPQLNPDEWRLATLVHSAIAGASLAATIELANSQTLSSWLLAASILFALALPASVATVVELLYFQDRDKSQFLEAEKGHPFWSKVSSLLALIAQLACFGGFLMLFWHVSWIAGVAFITTSLIAFVTLVALGRK